MRYKIIITIHNNHRKLTLPLIIHQKKKIILHKLWKIYRTRDNKHFTFVLLSRYCSCSQSTCTTEKLLYNSYCGLHTQVLQELTTKNKTLNTITSAATIQITNIHKLLYIIKFIFLLNFNSIQIYPIKIIAIYFNTQNFYLISTYTQI